MRDFFGCYLLTSQDPKNKGRTYIGFTVNPRRRLRQHNGEITAGAHRTKRGRPWDMVLVAYGFPTKVQALQFEWAWQHPTTSKAVRAAAQKIGPTAMRGAKGKVRLLFEMLNLDPWCYYPLQVQILSSAYTSLRTAKCLQPPPHVMVSTAPMEMLPVVVADDFDEGPPEEQADQEGLDESVLLSAESSMTGAMADSAVSGTSSEAQGSAEVLAPLPETAVLSEKERRKADKEQQKAEKEQQKELQKAEKAKEAAARLCCMCGEKADAKWLLCSCSARSHVECLAKRFLKEAGEEQGLPVQGTCPNCGAVQKWADVLAKCESVPWRQSSKARPRGQGKGRKAAAAVPQAAAGGTEVESPKPARNKGKGRPKVAPTDAAPASGRTAAQTYRCPTTSTDLSLIDMTGSDSASPAKKPKAAAPKAKAPAKGQAKGAKSMKEGAEGKPKGRKKKTEVLEELVPEAVPRGPSFPFDIHRVLALGNQCGLPTDQTTRDELSGQHGVLHRLSACQKTAADLGTAIPSAIGAKAVSESSASAQADCLADNHAYSGGRLWGRDCAQQLQASAGPTGTQEVPVSELSLRDRLQKVQCLLQQAGLSPAEAMMGLASPDALDAANAVRHTAIPGGTDDLLHSHVGSDDPTQDPDQAGSRTRAGSDSLPVPDLARGVTYDECLINLVSPTVGPSRQASTAGTDQGSPLGLPLLAPQLNLMELDPPSPCNCLPIYAASPLALVSHALLQQQQQHQQDEHAVMPAIGPVSSSNVCHNGLDPSRQKLLLQCEAPCFQQHQSAASPAVAEQRCGGLQVSHGVQSGASCQQSPGSSVDEVSQPGRKRSRSMPRGRKPAGGKMLKSPSQARVPSQQVQATDEVHSKTASAVEGRAMLDNNTPHSKTANKLAALQMSSPGYTPSPMPLRRRLQQQNQSLLQEAAPQIQCYLSQDECEVICID